MLPGRAPKPAAGRRPNRAVRRDAKVGDVVVGDGGIPPEVFGNQPRFFVDYVQPGLGGGIDQIALKVFEKSAAKPRTYINIGIHLR